MSAETRHERIRPLHDWAVIEVEKIEERTAGGLYVPQNAKNLRRRGRVKAVGPGKWLELGKRAEPEVKVGDVVIYMHHNVMQGISRADEEQGDCLIPISEIVAVVESA